MFRKLQAADAAYHALVDQYPQRKAAAEAQVSRWSYATAPRFDLGLQHFNRHGWAPGRATRQAPSTQNQGAALGLNAQGQVMVERCYNEIAFDETFVAQAADLVEVTHFDYTPEKRAIHLRRYECQDGRPLAMYSAARHGVLVEQFEWAGAQLRAVRVHHAPRNADGAFESPCLHHTDELSYAPNGKLQKIEVIWPGQDARPEQRSLVFERRSYGIYRKM